LIPLAAERTWRKLNGHELVPLVRAGVKFVDGARVEREVEAIDAVATQPMTAKRNTRKKHDQVAKVAA
jgi:hypothetical protein